MAPLATAHDAELLEVTSRLPLNGLTPQKVRAALAERGVPAEAYDRQWLRQGVQNALRTRIQLIFPTADEETVAIVVRDAASVESALTQLQSICREPHPQPATNALYDAVLLSEDVLPILMRWLTPAHELKNTRQVCCFWRDVKSVGRKLKVMAQTEDWPQVSTSFRPRHIAAAKGGIAVSGATFPGMELHFLRWRASPVLRLQTILRAAMYSTSIDASMIRMLRNGRVVAAPPSACPFVSSKLVCSKFGGRRGVHDSTLTRGPLSRSSCPAARIMAFGLLRTAYCSSDRVPQVACSHTHTGVESAGGEVADCSTPRHDNAGGVAFDGTRCFVAEPTRLVTLPFAGALGFDAPVPVRSQALNVASDRPMAPAEELGLRAPVRAYPHQLLLAEGVATSGGKVYVADRLHHRVVVYSHVALRGSTPSEPLVQLRPESSFGATWGFQKIVGTSQEDEAGGAFWQPKTLHSPTGVATHANEIFVADPGFGRVAVFTAADPVPAFARSVGPFVRWAGSYGVAVVPPSADELLPGCTLMRPPLSRIILSLLSRSEKHGLWLLLRTV